MQIAPEKARAARRSRCAGNRRAEKFGTVAAPEISGLRSLAQPLRRKSRGREVWRRGCSAGRAAYLKGLDLHERLATQLKGKLGLRNQNLVGFGLRPKRIPKSRITETPETPQPPPVQPPPAQEVHSAGPPGAQEVTPAAGVE
jgi:hypothetical protein